MSTIRRNLVISPIGDESMHASWLSESEARTFDLFLIHYGNQADFGRSEATHYVRQKGFKWELLHHALTNHGEILGRYDNIWAPDCDIRASTGDVNRLFELFDVDKGSLGDPRDGHFKAADRKRRSANAPAPVPVAAQ